MAIQEPGRIVNDIKRLGKYLLMGMHHNGPETYYSVSDGSPGAFPTSQLLFSHVGDADLHIVSIGFIVDEASTTVLGALYGAGAVPTLDHNRLQNGPTPIRVASKATKLQS